VKITSRLGAPAVVQSPRAGEEPAGGDGRNNVRVPAQIEAVGATVSAAVWRVAGFKLPRSVNDLRIFQQAIAHVGKRLSLAKASL